MKLKTDFILPILFMVHSFSYVISDVSIIKIENSFYYIKTNFNYDDDTEGQIMENNICKIDNSNYSECIGKVRLK